MKTTNLINELKEHLELESLKLRLLVINGLLDEQDAKELLEDDVYFMLGNLESMSESAHRIDWTLNK